MTFTKLEIFKIWGSYHDMSVSDIEKGLKNINKEGKTKTIWVNKLSIAPKPCPLPNNSHKN